MIDPALYNCVPAPIHNLRPTPRLFTAIVRLGLPAHSAAHILWQRRNDDDCGVARDLIRVAILQRRTSLAVHPAAQRDPSWYRPGFGRFPDARGHSVAA